MPACFDDSEAPESMPLQELSVDRGLEFEGPLDERKSSGRVALQGRQTKLNSLHIGVAYCSVLFPPFVK